MEALSSSETSVLTHFVFLRSVRRLLVTASVVPSSAILVTLMKEALSSSETSVLTRATRRNIPEDTTVHRHRRENLKSYNSSVLVCREVKVICNEITKERRDFELYICQAKWSLPSFQKAANHTSIVFRPIALQIQKPLSFR
jgi:hypothetical protein